MYISKYRERKINHLEDIPKHYAFFSNFQLSKCTVLTVLGFLCSQTHAILYLYPAVLAGVHFQTVIGMLGQI